MNDSQTPVEMFGMMDQDGNDFIAEWCLALGE